MRFCTNVNIGFRFNEELKPEKLNIKTISKSLRKDIFSKREQDFTNLSMSKLQIRKIMKSLNSTEHKSLLSSLVLSIHNPFSYNLPQMIDEDIKQDIQK